MDAASKTTHPVLQPGATKRAWVTPRLERYDIATEVRNKFRPGFDGNGKLPNGFVS